MNNKEETPVVKFNQDDQNLIADVTQQVNKLLAQHDLRLSVIEITVDGQKQVTQIQLVKIVPPDDK